MTTLTGARATVSAVAVAVAAATAGVASAVTATRHWEEEEECHRGGQEERQRKTDVERERGLTTSEKLRYDKKQEERLVHLVIVDSSSCTFVNF